MMTHRREDESTDSLTAESKEAEPAEIDVARSRFPFAIVWTPLPLLTWILPFIGHLGIADSRGVIYDFAGPYTIGEDNLAFGKPVRYITLDPAKAHGEGRSGAAAFDLAVARGCRDYSKRMHNLWCAPLAPARRHAASRGPTIPTHALLTRFSAAAPCPGDRWQL